MGTNEAENSIEDALWKIRNSTEERYKRESITFLEMSNILNWVISLLTALLIFFMDKVFLPRNCINIIFQVLFGIVLFALIYIFIVYKGLYVKFKRILDDILTLWTDDLNEFKIKKIVDKESLLIRINESIQLLHSISKEKFKLISNFDTAKQNSENKIDKYIHLLNCYYNWGIWISLVSLFLVPCYIVIKYLFVP